jgi:GNAT superfamily N-acetyltransferase
VKVRPREAADQAAALAFLARHNSLRGPAWGELLHPLHHPAFVAETPGGQMLGMLTYVPGQDWQQCEILTLHADQQWHGAGTALIEAAVQLARRKGCTRLWVITTNDNVDALRFYQRRGFCLVRVHRGAVDRSRASMKPEIPRWAPTRSRCATRSSSKDHPEQERRPGKGAVPASIGRWQFALGTPVHSADRGQDSVRRWNALTRLPHPAAPARH